MEPQWCVDYFTYSQDRVPSVNAARLCGIPKPHLWRPGALDVVAGYSTRVSKRKRFSKHQWEFYSSLFMMDSKILKECNRIFEVNSNSVNPPNEAQNYLVFMPYGSGVPYGRESSGRREEAEPDTRCPHQVGTAPKL